MKTGFVCHLHQSKVKYIGFTLFTFIILINYGLLRFVNWEYSLSRINVITSRMPRITAVSYVKYCACNHDAGRFLIYFSIPPRPVANIRQADCTYKTTREC